MRSAKIAPTLESTLKCDDARTGSVGRVGSGPDWFLPSGKGLTEFALQAGFVAPRLLETGIAGDLRARTQGAGGGSQ